MNARVPRRRGILPHFRTFTIWLAALIVTAGWVGANLDGPPVGHTGAPGEATCATAGCHDDHPVYAYPGDYLYLSTNGSHFLPGDTVGAYVQYQVASNSPDTGFERWGFELTAVGLDGDPTGQILVTDSLRTEFAIGANGRQYLRATPEGTLPDTTQPIAQRWSFKWVAPQDFDYPVALYVSAVGADDNGEPTGDWVNRTERWLYNPDFCFIETTGDVNWDGVVTTADIIKTIDFIYKGGTIPVCRATADVNCSQAFTSADIIYLVNYVFKAGPPPCDVCSIWQDPWTCP